MKKIQGINVEYDGLRELLLKVLQKYPSTRNSDTLLYIYCCKELGAKTVDDLMKTNLNVISVHKLRQVIQNKEGLYLPDKEIADMRKDRETKIRDYMRSVC